MQKIFIVLRPFQPGDEDDIVAGLNNFNVWKNLRDLATHPYTLQDAKKWIASSSHQSPSPTHTQFAIVIDGKIVGGIGITLGSGVYCKQAELGYWLAEPYWGNGIMTRAAKCILNYAFDTLKLHRISAGCYRGNAASEKILLKLGMQPEGCRRQACFKAEEFKDELQFGILENEWRSESDLDVKLITD